MDVREKLVELLEPHMSGLACEYESGSCELTTCRSCNAKNIADHLIANGVTVQEWYSVNDCPKEDGTYLVQTNTGTITTARFYAFKSFPATKHLPAFHRSASWQSNRNVVKWTFLPQPPKGE